MKAGLTGRAAGRRRRQSPARGDTPSLDAGRPAPGNQALQRSLTGAGARADTESRLGIGLGQVRVHSGAAAEGAARRLNARAFTAGDDIVLGSDADGLSLAHELIHVAQRARPGLGSRGGGDGAEREAERLAPALLAGTGPVRPTEALGPGIHRQADPDGAPPRSGPSSFAAETIDVAAMTNEKLISEARRVDDWLRGNGASDHPDQAEYWKLGRKLRAERRIRVAAGHVWLAAPGTTIPAKLIGLQAVGELHKIIEINADQAIGAPGSPDMMILTEEQFQAVLAANDVAVADLRDDPAATQNLTVPTYLGGVGSQPSGGPAPGTETQSGGGLSGLQGGQASAVGIGIGAAVNPKDIQLAKSFSTPTSKGWSQWTGKMGEGAYQGSAGAGWGFGTNPLNAQGWTDATNNVFHPTTQQNYPVMDFQRTRGLASKVLGVVRISAKTSLGTPLQRQAYYRKGIEDMLGGKAVDHYLGNQPEMAGLAKGTPAYDEAKRKILGNAYIVVNDDDVLPLQESLADATNKWKHKGYRRIYDAELSLNPIIVESVNGPLVLSSAADVDNATGVPKERLDEVKRTLGKRAKARVKGSGITTEHLRAAKQSRQSMPADADAKVPAQFVAQEKYGGGAKGTLKAMGRSAGQGAGFGSMIAIVTSGGMMMFDEADYPEWKSDLAAAIGTNATVAAVGGALEQTLVAQGTKYSLSEQAPKFVTPEFAKTGGRIITSSALGAGLELVSMGFEDRSHSTEEILVRTGRAMAVGTLTGEVGVATTGAGAVIFGAASTGAVSGSVVPGLGTAVGFVVGLAAGALTYYVLDETLPGGRQDWENDAAGLVSPPRPPKPESTIQVDNTRVEPRANPLSPWVLKQIQQDMDAEQGMKKEGTPFAEGVDDDAIPAGLGLRKSEQLEMEEW